MTDDNESALSGVNPPWHYRIMGRLFAPLMWKMFIKLGMLFYNQIVVRSDGKAVFFAQTEWDMVHGMEEYLNEDNDNGSK